MAYRQGHIAAVITELGPWTCAGDPDPGFGEATRQTHRALLTDSSLLTWFSAPLSGASGGRLRRDGSPARVGLGLRLGRHGERHRLLLRALRSGSDGSRG